MDRLVKVWDAPLRLFHWALVLCVLGLWFTGTKGALEQHFVIGKIALTLLVFRLVWGFIGSDTARFSHFVKGPGGVLTYLRTQAHNVGHNPLGALSVLAMLGMLLVQAGSGLFTDNNEDIQGPLTYLVSGKTGALLSSVHRLGFNLVLVLIALHLAAIAFYRFVKKDNLVRPMITGSRPAVGDEQGVSFASPIRAVIALGLAAGLVWGGLALWGGSMYIYG